MKKILLVQNRQFLNSKLMKNLSNVFSEKLIKKSPIFQDEEASILSKIKSEVLIDEVDAMEDSRNQQFQSFQENLKQHFTNISDNEFLNRSAKFIQSHKLKQEFDPLSHTKPQNIYQNYRDYSQYEKSFSKVTDRNLDDDGQAKYRQNMLLFIKNLDEEVEDKFTVKTMIEGARTDRNMTDDQVIRNMDIDSKIQAPEGEFNSTEGNEEDDELQKFEHQGRLSPQAREDIFRLYMKGWSVRDISLRYGIIPERAKAVIWQRRYFYDEVLPKIDLITLRLAMEREQLYNEWFPFVDYGIDLELMAEREKGVLQQHWNKKLTELKNIDTNQNDLPLNQKKEVKKHEFITEKFVGKGNKGFYVKEWVVNKGHASQRVSKMFKNIVHAGNDTYKLPKKVRSKLSSGPRIASQGYGSK